MPKEVKDGNAKWLDYGRDNYAGVTFSDIPATDGRRLFMGWMSNWDYAQVVPTEKWRSAKTLPRTLNLVKNKEGYRIISQPIEELEKLRVQSSNIEFFSLSGKKEIAQKISPTLSEVILMVEKPAINSKFGIRLSNSLGEIYQIGFDAAKNNFFSDRTKAGKSVFSEKFATKIHLAPRISTDSTVKLHLFFDKASAELFADDGSVVITDIFFPNEDFDKMELFSEGAAITIKGKVFELNGIW